MLLAPGSVVWGKVGAHPWWPALVVVPTDVQLTSLKISEVPENTWVVSFFNDSGYFGLLNARHVLPFHDKEKQAAYANHKPKRKKLSVAYKEAEHHLEQHPPGSLVQPHQLPMNAHHGLPPATVHPQNAPIDHQEASDYDTAPVPKPKKDAQRKPKKAKSSVKRRSSQDLTAADKRQAKRVKLNSSSAKKKTPTSRSKPRKSAAKPLSSTNSARENPTDFTNLLEYVPEKRESKSPPRRSNLTDAFSSGSESDGEPARKPSGSGRRDRTAAPKLTASAKEQQEENDFSEGSNADPMGIADLDSSGLDLSGEEGGDEIPRNRRLARKKTTRRDSDGKKPRPASMKGNVSKSAKASRLQTTEEVPKSIILKLRIRRPGNFTSDDELNTGEPEEKNGLKVNQSERNKLEESDDLSKENAADRATKRKRPGERRKPGLFLDEEVSAEPITAESYSNDELDKRHAIAAVTHLRRRLRHSSLDAWRRGLKLLDPAEIIRTSEEMNKVCSSALQKGEEFLEVCKLAKAEASEQNQERRGEMLEEVLRDIEELTDVFFDVEKVSLTVVGKRTVELCTELIPYSPEAVLALQGIIVLWIDVTDPENQT